MDEYLSSNIYRRSCKNLIFSLFITYMQRHQAGETESTISISKSEKIYRQINQYLQQNYREATLTSTAEHVHFSKQYICRIIKEVGHHSFSDILCEIKINVCKDYLSYTSLSLETIAELVGFSDGSHLSRLFKQKTGMSPSSYRLQVHSST